MNNLITKIIKFLANKWGGLVSLIILIFCNIAVAIGKSILGMVTEAGDTIVIYKDLDIRFYSNSQDIIDSLVNQIDSLQRLVNLPITENTRQVLIFTENMQPVIIGVTVLTFVLFAIGFYWRLRDRIDVKCKEKEANKIKIITK